MKIAVLSAAVLLAGGATYATHWTSLDVNRMVAGPGLTAAQIETLFETELDGCNADPIAVALFPGPMISHRIELNIQNRYYSPISHVILDVFRANQFKSLLIEQCWGLAPGELMYPYDHGRGPLVLEFTTFTTGEVKSATLDPDTYEDPAYGAKVMQMAYSVIEVVFEDGSRAIGQFTITDFGNVMARLYPTNVGEFAPPGPQKSKKLRRLEF